MSDIPSDIILSKRDRKMTEHSAALNKANIKAQETKNRMLYDYWGISFGDIIDNAKVTEIFYVYDNVHCLKGLDVVTNKTRIIKNSTRRITNGLEYRLWQKIMISLRVI